MQSINFVRHVMVFFCPSPLPFSGSTVLRLTRGPAGNRTTTGSLSAPSRATPYQLSHEDTFVRHVMAVDELESLTNSAKCTVTGDRKHHEILSVSPRFKVCQQCYNSTPNGAPNHPKLHRALQISISLFLPELLKYR